MDGKYSDYTHLVIDGKVWKRGLTVTSGSTVIDITAQAMETLAVGPHTVSVRYTDGQADGVFSVEKAVPKTGDGANTVLWIGMLLAGSAGLAVLLLRRRRS